MNQFTRTLTADLPGYLDYILKTDYEDRSGNKAINEATANSPMQIQHLLYLADIANFTRNSAAVLTDQARSSDSGDNRNMTTFLQGQAFESMNFSINAVGVVRHSRGDSGAVLHDCYLDQADAIAGGFPPRGVVSSSEGLGGT
ncbi:hypothetical protein CLIM01_09076 [Colletotrichum limetticola]|uniref:Uncharacterized protein n=1 Tax=Colletotrichum limetticola TaxID=1209924 RepID=A0ABQ9PPR2_9PEZI|nr:hypothetical protein CLIM01_09076 [Colletotrichum limetticola]